MRVINTVAEMQACADASRASGKTIALVPTMGFLHEGHVSLMRLARERADTVVVSIFVNPTQFGPNEDYSSYPRDWDRDLDIVTGAGADSIFAPDAAEMYPAGYQTSVQVSDITQYLCGASRPVHFEGVATVVTKLFNCVKPHIAIFGEKDFQQLMVIKRMVKDLNMHIEIVGAPIVREPDGLAMSSRNTYLTPSERAAALSLSRSLAGAQGLFQTGERNAAVLADYVSRSIQREDCARIDYIKVCDAETLRDIEVVSGDALLAVAVYFGKARLIDNMVLQADEKIS